MRIISKFHDYYDSVMVHGQDKTTLYLRNTEESDKCPKKLHSLYKELPSQNIYFRSNSLAAIPFLVVVCDKIHLGYYLEFSKNLAPKKYVYAYCLKTVADFIKENDEKEYEIFIDSQKRGWFSRHFTHKNLAKSFEEYENKKEAICIDENAPLLYYTRKHYREGIYIKNPVLRDYAFFKKMDAFTIYQELAMYISGVMGGQSPKMVEVKEKDRISKHGFDKWSFRKKGKNSK